MRIGIGTLEFGMYEMLLNNDYDDSYYDDPITKRQRPQYDCKSLTWWVSLLVRGSGATLHLDRYDIRWSWFANSSALALMLGEHVMAAVSFPCR